MTNPNAIEDAKAELAREMRLLTSLCAMFDAAIGHSEPADRQTIRVQEIRELGTRASRALAALSEMEGEAKQKLKHAYIVTHKGDGRHAAIVYTLEDAAREAIAGMWAGSLEEALEQEDLLHIYEAIRNPESDEWADYDGEEISFSFEDGSLSVLSIPVKVAALSAPTVSGLTEEERAEGLGLAHQTPTQDVEIEYWLNQADNYAEVSMPCDDLRSLIARALSPAETRGLDQEGGDE